MEASHFFTITRLIIDRSLRLAEGHGEAMYEIGVADNGKLVGLTRKDMESSLQTLRKMGSRLNADVSIIRERKVRSKSKNRRSNSHEVDEGGFDFGMDLEEEDVAVEGLNDEDNRVVAEVLVRKCLSDDQHFLEIRVAIIGGADAGSKIEYNSLKLLLTNYEIIIIPESTLLGVLSTSELDNGRGKARLNLLKHRHEIESGRTSSISHQVIGFNPRGDLINYGTTNVNSWEHICEMAAKVITFLDLCGHPKYQKTTLSGLTGRYPDYSCLIIGANAGNVSEVPREHLSLSVLLKMPIFLVVSFM
jgi:GTPase